MTTATVVGPRLGGWTFTAHPQVDDEIELPNGDLGRVTYIDDGQRSVCVLVVQDQHGAAHGPLHCIQIRGDSSMTITAVASRTSRRRAGRGSGTCLSGPSSSWTSVPPAGVRATSAWGLAQLGVLAVSLVRPAEPVFIRKD